MVTAPIDEAPLPDLEQDAPTPDDATEDEAPAEPSGRRAARQRAQEAEARAEAAEARLAAAHRREVERLAAATLAQGGDVLDEALGGVTLADLLDADGEVDPELVAEAAAAVAAQRPGLGIARPQHQGGHFDGGVRTPPPRRSSWASLLRGER